MRRTPPSSTKSIGAGATTAAFIHPRVAALRASAQRHGEAGIASVTGEDYAGGHWLASFATYYVTGRALDAPEWRAMPSAGEDG